MTALTFAVVFLGLAFLALCFGFLVLARQIGVLYERIAPMGALMNDSGPQVGEQSPKFTLESLNGGVVSIGTVKETATLVFFVSPTCPICKKLIPILRSIRSSEGDWLTVVLASDGDEDKQRRFIDNARLDDFDYVLSTELGLGFRVARLPYAVVLDRSGAVRAKGLVNTREQLESLFNAHDMGVASIQNYIGEAQDGEPARS
ncbi:methylamine dehydrogenase accessory protein MauD [Salinisphaera sp.]|uniref:methylamine dehydrogenase accessory protein MauD n=1 Tax=Salinisphaera sp. TaxID=1914330 RepID=UPI000C617B2F|nr:methylamine dehydrogenase accessory protein MauD [Salinisphaera sp.]MBS64319.1 methylamine dehydrogenase accessory protein MauD [Salinisphaera sp.]